MARKGEISGLPKDKRDWFNMKFIGLNKFRDQLHNYFLIMVHVLMFCIGA